MSVKILYFASLREALGVAGEELTLAPGVRTVGDLRAHLSLRSEAWSALASTKNLRTALNQHMVDASAAVVDGDEIAFFPPVTGG